MHSNYPLIIMYSAKEISPEKIFQLYSNFKKESGVDVLLIPDSMSVINNMPKEQLVFLRDKINDMIQNRD